MSAGANVCFALLDVAVVEGRADDPVVAGTTHARLLEEAAALAGVLRHLGVGPGVRVGVDLPHDEEHDLPAVTAALATARVGGVVTRGEDPEAVVLLVAEGSSVPVRGRPRLVLGAEVGEPDLDWRVMLRAGRSDPAAVVVLPLGSPYSPTRTVGEQVELVREGTAPWSPAALRDLLQV